MRLTFKTPHLRKAFINATKVVDPKCYQAMATFVQVNYEQTTGQIMLLSTNLEISSRATVPVESVEGDPVKSFLVTPTQITNLIKDYKGEEVILDVKQTGKDKMVLDVILEKGSYSFSIITNDVVPMPAEESYTDTFTIDAKSFVENLSMLADMCAEDSMRPALGAVVIDVTNAGINMVATDTRKLLCKKIDDIPYLTTCRLLISKMAVPVIRELIGKNPEGNIQIQFNENNLEIVIGENRINCRQVVGAFPNYLNLFPVSAKSTLIMDREELISTLKRMSYCSDTGNHCVKMEMQEGKTTLSFSNSSLQIGGSEVIESDYCGESMAVGFNLILLIQILKSFSSERIKIDFISPNHAAFFVADNEDVSLRGLLVPLKF